MTREVLTVGIDTPIKGVAHILSSHHISGLPVCDADGLVLGVVSEADILRKEEGVPRCWAALRVAVPAARQRAGQGGRPHSR